MKKFDFKYMRLFREEYFFLNGRIIFSTCCCPTSISVVSKEFCVSPDCLSKRVIFKLLPDELPF